MHSFCRRDNVQPFDPYGAVTAELALEYALEYMGLSAVMQPLGADQPPPYEERQSSRFVLIERPVKAALNSTLSRAPIMVQVRGWSIVAGIFGAAILCWIILIMIVMELWRLL